MRNSNYCLIIYEHYYYYTNNCQYTFLHNFFYNYIRLTIYYCMVTSIIQSNTLDRFHIAKYEHRFIDTYYCLLFQIFVCLKRLFIDQCLLTKSTF